MLYGIYIASSNIEGITIILGTLMVIIWVLQVLLEIVTLVFEPKVKLIMAGVITDAKPIINTYNFFHKKENDIIVDYAEYRKEINILSEKIEETKNKKQKVKIFFGKRNNLEK